MENEGRLSDTAYLSGLEDMIICIAEAIAKMDKIARNSHKDHPDLDLCETAISWVKYYKEEEGLNDRQ